ncbi:MAG: ABC-type transport auxiliary lipoprotein family protein, partial [Candidatus Cloacimonas sp.]|nr:ABC-type transport auxiliary lipoprotein family protein [Candidatus Cloacimonas sp.]
MMQKHKQAYIVIGWLFIIFALSGCFGKVDRLITNYYVLDYQNSGEKLELRRPVNNGKMLQVQNTTLSKTYDRNQIVVKENFYRVSFLQTDVWASKLRDAIPNIVAQRLRAYNIFGQISRGEIIDKVPSYFLETTVLNIEKIAGADPKAYLRMEFVLRDSTSQTILFTHRNERY